MTDQTAGGEQVPLDEVEIAAGEIVRAVLGARDGRLNAEQARQRVAEVIEDVDTRLNLARAARAHAVASSVTAGALADIARGVHPFTGEFLDKGYRPPATPISPKARRIVRVARGELLTAALDGDDNRDTSARTTVVLNQMSESLHPMREELGADWFARAAAQVIGELLDVLAALVRTDPGVADLLGQLVLALELTDATEEAANLSEVEPDDVARWAENILRDNTEN